MKKNYLKSKEHIEDHSKWDRRGFLKILGLAGAGSISLGNTDLSVLNSNFLTNSLSNSVSDRVLVLIRLKGGNDGLNTLIPLNQYDTYMQKRPTLYIPNNKILKLDDSHGIPEHMSNIMPFWNEGKLKIVNGVGYENQNLSHFTSSDFWATGSTDKNEMISTGWLGRYYDEKYFDYSINPPDKPIAIQIGSQANLIFNGADRSYAFAVANEDRLERVAERGEFFDTTNLPDCTHGDQLEFLRKVCNTTYDYADVISQAFKASSDYNDYDSNIGLENQLRLVARLIKGGLGSKIYMVTLNGFDTHGNQKLVHETLLNQLSNSVNKFYQDLNNDGHDKRVLSVTFSEFGRRVHENGSEGTDHGSVAPIFLFGPALKGSGIIGDWPSLSELNNRGNMNNSLDFRSIYQTILKDWLCGDPEYIEKAMLGDEYDLIGLGFGCNDKDIIDYSDLLDYHHPIYSSGTGTVNLQLRIKQTHRVKIRVYDILGRFVSSVYEGDLNGGEHVFPLDNVQGGKISSGQYFYRIGISGGNILSKSFVVR